MKKKTRRSGHFIMVSLLLFAAILAIVFSATFGISDQSKTESAKALQQAIERAAVLCYATEGYYPPGLDYISNNYGIQIDYANYFIHYEIFASNIRPTIRVEHR